MMSLLSRHSLLKVDLVSSGQLRSLTTAMIFVGNNALQLRDLAMDVAQCMKKDLLAVVVMKPITKIETIRILLRGVFKTLDSEEKLDMSCADEITIHTRKPVQIIALDGETMLTPSPLRIRALPEVLNLVKPPPVPAAPSSGPQS